MPHAPSATATQGCADDAVDRLALGSFCDAPQRTAPALFSMHSAHRWSIYMRCSTVRDETTHSPERVLLLAARRLARHPALAVRYCGQIRPVCRAAGNTTYSIHPSPHTANWFACRAAGIARHSTAASAERSLAQPRSETGRALRGSIAFCHNSGVSASVGLSLELSAAVLLCTALCAVVRATGCDGGARDHGEAYGGNRRECGEDGAGNASDTDAVVLYVANSCCY